MRQGLMAVATAALALVLAAAGSAAAWHGGLLAGLFTRAQGEFPLHSLLVAIPLLVVAAGAEAAAGIAASVLLHPHQRRLAAGGAALLFLVAVLSGVVTAEWSLRRGRVYEVPAAPPVLGAYSLRYPPRWTLFPPSHPGQGPGTVTLTSWAAPDPAAPTPAGGLRVVIRPYDDGEQPAADQTGASRPLAEEPFAVGAERYPGAIRRLPGRAAGSGGEQVVEVVYDAGGRTWQVSGTFAEAPDAANPRASDFYGVVASLRHH